jgi:hypothetical protein
LELVANCGVVVRVESSIFVVFFFEFTTASSEYGGELSFLISLLVIELV